MSPSAVTLVVMLHTPAASGTTTGTVTAILETPETVAIAMRTAHSLGHTERVDSYITVIGQAREAAAASVLPMWTLDRAEVHLAPHHDPTIPQPHVHLTISGVTPTQRHTAEAWAAAAHERFQASLRRALGYPALVDQPHPPGWEIRALVPRLGSIGRHRCLPPSNTVLYPADTAAPRVSPPVQRTA